MAKSNKKFPLKIAWWEKVQNWVEFHYLQLALFNVVLVILLLLRSAGYFEPYFGITINSIFLMALVLSIFLLGTRSKAAFAVALVFWLLAAILKLAKIDVWAERNAIYSFQALTIGVLLFIVESITISIKGRHRAKNR